MNNRKVRINSGGVYKWQEAEPYYSKTYVPKFGAGQVAIFWLKLLSVFAVLAGLLAWMM
jgi:hypothetical protein